MLRKPLSWNVKQVCTMIKKGSISFDNPLQRPSGQWKDHDKTLLIDSLLTMFVPEIYAIQIKTAKGNVYDIIDGLQRLTIISSYINDEWALTDLELIKLESTGETYNISGKKFSELPEEVQEEIKGFSLTFKAIEIEEGDDEETIVEKVFYRLNNGKAVSKEHLALVTAPRNVQEFCRRIMTEHRLFTEVAKYTESSTKKSDKQMTILQSILLISGLQYESFAAKHVEEAFAKATITDEVLERTEQAFTDIADTFKELNKFVVKVNIPIMAYMFANSTNDNKEQAKESLLEYIKGSKPGDKYRSNTGSGSVKKEKVTKRINVMLEICGVEEQVREVKQTPEEQNNNEQEQSQETQGDFAEIMNVFNEIENQEQQEIVEPKQNDINLLV